MNGILDRLVRLLGHKGGPDSPLCFYDTLHKRWVNLIPGQHICLIGVSGSGKSNLLADLLANLQPATDTGFARIYGIDLKGGVELGRFGGYLTGLATTLDETLAMLETLDRRLDQRMGRLRAAYATDTPMSRDTPLIFIVIDEAAELTGGIDKTTRQQQERIRVLLDRILRLGRACGYTVLMASQDPRKEALPLRDRCPARIALRLNSIDEARMLLGDNAIQAGAAPWLISPRQPGTGYLYDNETNTATRFQGQHVPDHTIRELRDTHPRIATNHDPAQTPDRNQQPDNPPDATNHVIGFRETGDATARRATRMA